MSDRLSDPCTAFQGHNRLHSGPRLETALAVKRAKTSNESEQILVFEDSTGGVVDLDLRGSDAEIQARLASPPARYAGRHRPTAGGTGETDTRPRGRGRPKLGVVAREVTLLPRHWDWLSSQPGGASAALRRLVDEARRNPDSKERQRIANEAAYRFLQAIAGDLPNYEEVTRALFSGNMKAFEQRMSDWPNDIREYALRLARAN